MFSLVKNSDWCHMLRSIDQVNIAIDPVADYTIKANDMTYQIVLLEQQIQDATDRADVLNVLRLQQEIHNVRFAARLNGIVVRLNDLDGGGGGDDGGNDGDDGGGDAGDPIVFDPEIEEVALHHAIQASVDAIVREVLDDEAIPDVPPIDEAVQQLELDNQKKKKKKKKSLQLLKFFKFPNMRLFI